MEPRLIQQQHMGCSIQNHLWFWNHLQELPHIKHTAAVQPGCDHNMSHCIKFLLIQGGAQLVHLSNSLFWPQLPPPLQTANGGGGGRRQPKQRTNKLGMSASPDTVSIRLYPQILLEVPPSQVAEPPLSKNITIYKQFLLHRFSFPNCSSRDCFSFKKKKNTERWLNTSPI